MFSWQMGPIKMTTIVDYDAVKSLLMADNKVRSDKKHWGLRLKSDSIIQELGPAVIN